MNQRNEVRLRHILEEAEDIEAFVFDGAKDKKTLKAVIRSLEVIEEAVRPISPEFKTEHALVRWRDIQDMCNPIACEYFRIEEHIMGG